jgi:ribosomal protein S18 acetylase RimI-like enzyme
MLVRDYVPEDFPKLQLLWLELDMGGEERGDSPEIILQTIKQGGRLIVLEDADSKVLVGSSWMTFDGRRFSLHHFGIKKKYQRQGWGLELAQESIKFIKQQGYQVRLEVHKDNEAAIKLYTKLGFFSFTDYDIFMIRKVDEL